MMSCVPRRFKCGNVLLSIHVFRTHARHRVFPDAEQIKQSFITVFSFRKQHLFVATERVLMPIPEHALHSTFFVP